MTAPTRIRRPGVGAPARALRTGLAVWLATVVAVPVQANRLTREEKGTVPVKGENRIYVKNARGKTIIVGRKGAGEVSIRAIKVVKARNSSEAEEWMEELNFDVDSDGEQISIITRHPDRSEGESFWSFLRRIKYKAYIDYAIEVPSRFDAKVSCASGDVQITSIEGDAKVFGSSGDVFVQDLGGDAFVEISSGDVEIRRVSGDIWLRSSSGDAIINETSGSVNLRASSGDIDATTVGGNAAIELASGDFWIRDCRGTVRAKTVSGDGEIIDVGGGVEAVSGSGDLNLRIIPVGEKDFVVKTSSGDVRVTFVPAEGYGFVLEVGTSSGSIEGDLDIQLEKISRRVLRGVVGNGKGRVLVETASGNVRIEQKEH